MVCFFCCSSVFLQETDLLHLKELVPVVYSLVLFLLVWSEKFFFFFPTVSNVWFVVALILTAEHSKYSKPLDSANSLPAFGLTTLLWSRSILLANKTPEICYKRRHNKVNRWSPGKWNCCSQGSWDRVFCSIAPVHRFFFLLYERPCQRKRDTAMTFDQNKRMASWNKNGNRQGLHTEMKPTWQLHFGFPGSHSLQPLRAAFKRILTGHIVHNHNHRRILPLHEKGKTIISPRFRFKVWKTDRKLQM